MTYIVLFKEISKILTWLDICSRSTLKSAFLFFRSAEFNRRERSGKDPGQIDRGTETSDQPESLDRTTPVC